ncbi:MAG TPA: hypothetical protein VMD59_22060, partial [Acidimicrobiales bacterium]|nr:hypothetical protein [Acidimicrobiales bacterium]
MPAEVEPARRHRRPARRALRLGALAIPVALLAAAVGPQIAGSGSGSAGVATLSLTGQSGSTLVEQLTAVSFTASRRSGAPGSSGPSYLLVGTTGIEAASVDER